MTETVSCALSEADRARLDALSDELAHQAEHCVGFPWNARFDYGELFGFLKYPINNDGDPYGESGYQLNTHAFEREVVAELAELTRAPRDSYWGYVNSGGTEGNLYGIFLARELHPDGVFYCSVETFSIKKLLRSLRVPTVMVGSRDDGCIDLEDLGRAVQEHADRPAIVLANIGTTLKGAIDDLPGIHRVLDQHGVPARYVHADAALAGMVLPFVDSAPPWNFDAGIDSLSISLHKFVGSPLPCGVVLASKEKLDQVAGDGRGRLDTTILASRNAMTPLFLWYAFRTIGVDGFRQRVRECAAVADYAIERLSRVGVSAWRHPYSNTVVFDRPSDEIVKKWQLFADDSTAHLIAMPQVTRERVDRFVEDLARDAAASPRETCPPS